MNRFTHKIDSLQISDVYDQDYWRFNWEELLSISWRLYSITEREFFQMKGLIAAEEFACRWLFLSFLSNMSDKDLNECFPELVGGE